MALSTIPFSGLGADASKQGINFRNLIINGDMSISQRGTSFDATQNYKIDRFRFAHNSYGFDATLSQSTDVPTGQGFSKSLKFNCTTASSVSAGGYLILQQKIEGQMLQQLKKGTSNAESLTWSFWVKSNKTGTYIAELYDADNSRQISKSYTINSADTWEKKTITYAGDTTGAFDNDNAQSLQVNFWLAAGSDFSSGTLNTSWNSITDTNRVVGSVNLTDSTSNYINITGVQLEVGTSASDFEFLPYDVNLQRCQRYYHQIGHGLNGGGTVNAGQGQWYSASEVVLTVYFPTSMRATPSMTTPTVSSGYRFHSAGSYVDVSNGGSIDSASNIMTGIYKSGLSGGSGGQASFLNMIASGASYKFDAEL